MIRTFKRYRDPVLRVWLEMFFTPDRCQFSNNLLSHGILFRLNALIVTAQAHALDLSRRGTNSKAILIPERHEEQPRPGIPLPGFSNTASRILYLLRKVIFPFPASSLSKDVHTNS